MVENIKNLAEQSSAWPFREANKLQKDFSNNAPKKGYILLYMNLYFYILLDI